MSVFARDLGTGDRTRRRSNWGREAHGLGQAKVLQDSSTSALGWRAQTVTPQDLEKASPIYPQDQPAAP